MASLKPVKRVSKAPEDFHSIAAALESAEEGDVIVLAEGLYTESVLVERSVDLQGEGEVAIRASKGPSLRVTGADVEITGLSFSSGDPEAGPTVLLQGAGVVLRECRVTSQSGICVQIEGAKAEARLVECHVEGGSDAGVFVRQGASAVFEECLIRGNTNPGLVANEQSHVQVIKCRFEDGKTNGIFVRGGSDARIEDCTLTRCGSIGLAIAEGATALVRCCTIDYGVKEGVSIYKGGQARFEDCTVERNRLTNLVVRSGAQAELRRCHFRDGLSAGVEVFEVGSAARFEDCTWRNHYSPALLVHADGKVEVRACQFQTSRADAIKGYERAQLDVRDSEVWEHRTASVALTSQSRLLMKDCLVRDGGDAGLYVFDGGTARLSGCTLRNNRIANLFVTTENSDVVADDCHFEGGAGVSVVVQNEAVLNLSHCRIEGAADTGLVVRTQGKAVLDSCHLQNSLTAAQISDHGEARAVSCEVVGSGHVGIRMRCAELELHDCRIAGNGQEGVVLNEKAHLGATDCRFEDNGGSHLLALDASDFSLTRCHLSHSKAAALHLREQSQGSLSHCQIESNGGSALEANGGVNVSWVGCVLGAHSPLMNLDDSDVRLERCVLPKELEFGSVSDETELRLADCLVSAADEVTPLDVSELLGVALGSRDADRLRFALAVDGAPPSAGAVMLMLAELSSPSWLRRLISDGVPVDTLIDGERTLLLWAVEAGDDALVELLLKLGADPSLRDGHGRDARALAEACEHVQLIERFKGD